MVPGINMTMELDYKLLLFTVFLNEIDLKFIVNQTVNQYKYYFVILKVPIMEGEGVKTLPQ